MDQPDQITHLTASDSVPIGEALARADARFAAAWGHWFFYARPDIPERVINADPDAWYCTGPAAVQRMGEENYADFREAIHTPDVVLGCSRTTGPYPDLPHPHRLVHRR